MAARTTAMWLERSIAWRRCTKLRVDWMIVHHWYKSMLRCVCACGLLDAMLCSQCWLVAPCCRMGLCPRSEPVNVLGDMPLMATSLGAHVSSPHCAGCSTVWTYQMTSTGPSAMSGVWCALVRRCFEVAPNTGVRNIFTRDIHSPRASGCLLPSVQPSLALPCTS